MDKDLSRLIRSFLEHLEVEKNCSKLTVRNYQHYLQTFLDFVGGEKGGQPIIDDLDLDLIRRYRLFLSRKKGVDGEMRSVTQGYYIIALRSFLKWLSRNDYRVLPPERLEVPKSRDHSLKFLDGEQVERLLNQPILSTKSGLRDKAILELLFSTGLRVSELTALNRDDVNLQTREFGVVGKGGRSRVVFISRRAAGYLERYLRSRVDHYKPLFINYPRKKAIELDEEKTRLSVRSVQRLVGAYVRKAKLPVMATPHTIRHSMATDLLRSGADLRSVQEILGHKNIATTQIYTHVTNARLREVHERFHSGNKEK